MSVPSGRDRGAHWEGRLRGLRDRRALPGTVSDPARAAAAIFMAHPWVARMTAEYKPELSICKAAEPRRFDDPLLVSEQMPA